MVRVGFALLYQPGGRRGDFPGVLSCHCYVESSRLGPRKKIFPPNVCIVDEHIVMFCLIFTKKKIKNLDCSRIGNMAHFLQWMTLIISFKLPFSAYLERKKIFPLNICIIDEYFIIFV